MIAKKYYQYRTLESLGMPISNIVAKILLNAVNVEF